MPSADETRTERVPAKVQSRSGERPPLDPRAEKTRQIIYAAAQQLMADGTASITVSDIVRTAGISRSSFYAHFSSLDEFATEFLDLQFAELESAPVGSGEGHPVTGVAAARDGYRVLIAHLVEHYPLYSTVLEMPLTRSAYDDIVHAYANRMLETVLVLTPVPPGVNAETVATYVAGGAVTLISAWMRGHLDHSDDQLVDELVSLLPAWLSDTQPTYL